MQDLLFELESVSSNISIEVYERILAIASKYGLGDELKKCFQYEPGWIFVGLDFASLEDRISAVTTKDPAKLAVYLYGFDGHSLRAQTYFRQHMPDIERAPEGARCFKVETPEQAFYFHEHEQVTYMGKTMTGAELVKLLGK